MQIKMLLNRLKEKLSSTPSTKKRILIVVLSSLVGTTILIFLGRLWPEKFLLMLLCFILLFMILECVGKIYDEKRKKMEDGEDGKMEDGDGTGRRT